MIRFYRFTIALLFLLAFTGLLPSQSNIHEVIVSGLPYTWVALVLTLVLKGSVLNGRERRLMWAGLSAVSIILGSWLAPFYFGGRSVGVDGPKIKVMAANVEYSNTDYAEFAALLDREQPDILGVTEVTDEWNRTIAPKFPYSANFRAPIARGGVGYGIGLYSRYPLGAVDSSLGDDVPPVVMTTVSPVDGRNLSVFLFHGIGPQLPETVFRNRLIYRRLAAKVREAAGDKIILGDFNVTPFSVFYRRFVEWTKAHNAAEGFGFFRTWDIDYFPLRFWLDHILYSGDLVPTDFRTVGPYGSDHLAVMTELQLLPVATKLQAQR